jgi:hypothetical protein
MAAHFENLCFPLLLPFITMHPDATAPTYNERVCEQSLRALERLLTKSDGFWTNLGARGRWLELMQEVLRPRCTPTPTRLQWTVRVSQMGKVLSHGNKNAEEVTDAALRVVTAAALKAGPAATFSRPIAHAIKGARACALLWRTCRALQPSIRRWAA